MGVAFEIACVALTAMVAEKIIELANGCAAKYGRPQGRVRHHWGLALALSGSAGGWDWKPRQRLTHYRIGEASDHRERNHVLGIAMQIPTTLRSLAPGTYPFNLCW